MILFNFILFNNSKAQKKPDLWFYITFIPFLLISSPRSQVILPLCSSIYRVYSLKRVIFHSHKYTYFPPQILRITRIFRIVVLKNQNGSDF